MAFEMRCETKKVRHVDLCRQHWGLDTFAPLLETLYLKAMVEGKGNGYPVFESVNAPSRSSRVPSSHPRSSSRACLLRRTR